MTQQSSADTTVSIAFAANDFYVPYLSALFASLVEHFSNDRSYELIVLSEDFEERHVTLLREQVERKNVHLNMVDVTQAMRPYDDKIHVYGHFRRETYFRLLLPQLLPHHHKVLYLDADMICLRDVAELYDTDIDGYLIAACHDADTTGIYNGVDVDLSQPDKRGYMDNVLKLKNPYDYFQAGTILFNLDAWREFIDVEEVFQFAHSHELQLLDQDVLNVFCEGRVKFVDMAWNLMYNYGGWRIREIISHSTPELYDAYMSARKDPYIVHYAGPIKPWDDPECDFADCFWRYARQTPFYEVALYRTSTIALRRDLDDVDQRLEALRGWVLSIDAELQRYEHRSIGLMMKEFVYQKVFTPLVNLVTADNEDAKDKIYEAYRKVHPAATNTMADITTE